MHEPELYSYVVTFEVAGMTRPLRQVVLAYNEEEARLLFAGRMPGGKVLNIARDEPEG